MPEPISGLFFALHTFCNFNCKYCWQKNSPSLKLNTKLDLKLVDMIIDDFFENYILLLPSSTKFEIVFSGGEGLFFFDELMHYITKIRGYSNILSFSPEIVIQTNGSLLDARKIDFLANNRVSLYFSFDGAGQNTTRQDFDKVLHNLKMSCKKLNVTVNSVFTPETQSKIYETYRILDKIGVKKWGFSSDFLQDKSYYDLPLITREISKILDDSPTMYIKNFSNGKDEVKWSKEILRSVSQVSITPFGAYHPTNFIYTGKSDPSFFNFDFGNVYKGFNQEHFDQYVAQRKEEISKMVLIQDNEVVPEKIAKNIFGNLSRFKKVQP